MDINETIRVQFQANEEWIQEYEMRIKDIPTAHLKDTPRTRIPLLKYETHRTTKHGSLVMAFKDIKTGQEVDAFFNVEIKRQRGTSKGNNYRTGEGGQFLPKPRSKFRKFWMAEVGVKPRRWASVHKEMRSKLRGHIFTGKISTGYNKNDSPFLKIDNIKIIETTTEQTGNKFETKKEQIL